ncbi:MAG: hypothetical protein U5L09_05915 [Bacteroidales bacterium]|nr:hypothetical protein [Bacteroidales bacterium]
MSWVPQAAWISGCSNYPAQNKPYAIKVPGRNRSDVKNPSVAMPVNINNDNSKNKSFCHSGP